MSPDKPFVYRAGNDEITALYNRANAIARINHLCGLDVRKKSKEYKYLVDCEMYSKYYKDNPMEVISEEYCQRFAYEVKKLECEKLDVLNKALEGAEERAKQLYSESKKWVAQEPLKDSERIETFLEKIIRLFRKKYEMVGPFFKCKTKKV